MSDSNTAGWAQQIWGSSHRSTLDIVWSCLSIIIVCTYRVVHLNLPAKRETGGRFWHFRFWVKPLRKLKWMVIMALSPEIVLSICIADYLWARDSVSKFAKISSTTKQSDTLSRVDSEKMDVAVLEEAWHVNCEPVEWTKAHAHYANMGGYVLKFEASTKPTDVVECIPLFANQVFELVTEFGLEIPRVSSDDIKDRSKTDIFTKAFALGQSTWLILQCIARSFQGLAVTQLELATIAFVVCAVAAYLLWWSKPFDVDQPLIISCPFQKRCRVLKRMEEMFSDRYKSKFLSFQWDDLLNMRRIPNWAYMDDIGLGKNIWLLTVLFILSVGTVFSAIHVAAWNFEFPTAGEQTSWRTVTLLSTLICIQEVILLPFVGDGGKFWQRWLVILWVMPLWGCYILMRAVILIQIFISMRRMPESAYQTVDWIAFMPHFD